MEIDIPKLEIDKRNYDKRKKIISKIKDTKIQINENIIENNKNKEKINKYLENEKFINKNIKINENINNINNIISILNNEKNNNSDNKSIINKNLILKNKTIEDYNILIKKFKKQENINFIHNTYMKSMHRDGLPSYLLKKSIHLINNYLQNLLSYVDFDLIFDEELNLKMKSKIDNNTYNAIEGSGKERTFHACALKMALRKINHTSKPNFILFDEIMIKMVDKSIDEFSNFLYDLKNHIDKIILIEHIHHIDYDYLINVTKDKNGISSLSMD